MAKVDGATTDAAPARSRGAAFRSWKIIAILLVLLAAIGGAAGYWYLFLRAPTQAANEQAAKPELPLPFYLEIKPFVVSIMNSAGAPHFVQLGVNLALSGSDAGNAVTALLPEVQDTMRQTAVAFKVDDIVTPAGIDKLRQAMIANANRVLLLRLGPERVNRLSSGEPNGTIIQNIYFTTLIVE
jgi:flagellar basal body-associated protein FliL